ncbi:hypothetical protein [Pseudolysinimonas yzui]|uniref:Uncharacterized protein n=1 Tax=Pseudolysinimonas yzui TaxID=2708254 RepID=A0A8J3M279_9MICO|nr:hypothetical protein [Pseudolysinimonas yzui]GHF06467.1 hypothetical protein GCM10011600_03840 [Pseudolysinimonas yzui]
MIRVARPTVLLLAATLALTALTGCTPNVVNGAHSWLNGQDGVESAEVVVDRTSLFETSGVIRGELDADLDDAVLDALVERSVEYVSDHPGVEFRLGYDDVDFRIGEASATAAARELWDDVVGLGGVVAAVIDPDLVHLYVLRSDTHEVLEALRDSPVAVQVESFRGDDDMIADRRDDDYGPLQRSHGSFQFLWGGACEPSEETWGRALESAGFDAIDGGVADVCGGYDLVYRPETDLTVVALEWAEHQELSREPAPTFTVSEEGDGHHEIQVTPGDASLFPVVAALETSGAPTVQYTLAADGTLVVQGWDSPPTTVFDLVAGSPLAARLTSITIAGDAGGFHEGGSIEATGTLDQISTLIADAEALIPLHESFYGVAITPQAVRLGLYSPPGSDPDMPAAAAALRTSPIWTTRPMYVDYLNGSVLIENGVATIGDDYTDRAPYDAFVAAWNGG